MAEKDNWSTPTLREAPYWRDGMTPEEYEEEREYYYRHLEDVKKCRYKPLWKQRKEGGVSG